MDEGSENLGESRNVSLDILRRFRWCRLEVTAVKCVGRADQSETVNQNHPGSRFFDNFPNPNGGLPAEGCLVIQSCPHFAPCSIMDGEDS
jgi:hypothetical protein